MGSLRPPTSSFCPLSMFGAGRVSSTRHSMLMLQSNKVGKATAAIARQRHSNRTVYWARSDLCLNWDIKLGVERVEEACTCIFSSHVLRSLVLCPIFRCYLSGSRPGCWTGKAIASADQVLDARLCILSVDKELFTRQNRNLRKVRSDTVWHF